MVEIAIEQLDKLNKIIINLHNEIDKIKQENDELRKSLSDSLLFKFQSQDKEVDKYKNALNEIEEIVKEYSPLVVATPLYKIDNILQKIKEVKSDE